MIERGLPGCRLSKVRTLHSGSKGHLIDEILCAEDHPQQVRMANLAFIDELLLVNFFVNAGLMCERTIGSKKVNGVAKVMSFVIFFLLNYKADLWLMNGSAP